MFLKLPKPKPTPEPSKDEGDAEPHQVRAKKACNRCRIKKIRCDGQYPCARCERDKTACQVDRRQRIGPQESSRLYLSDLESQHRHLLDALRNLYQQDPNNQKLKDLLARLQANGYDIGMPALPFGPQTPQQSEEELRHKRPRVDEKVAASQALQDGGDPSSAASAIYHRSEHARASTNENADFFDPSKLNSSEDPSQGMDSLASQQGGQDTFADDVPGVQGMHQFMPIGLDGQPNLSTMITDTFGDDTQQADMFWNYLMSLPMDGTETAETGNLAPPFQTASSQQFG